MKHRFETGVSKTGSPQQAFVIEVETLNAQALQALAEYLTSSCNFIYDKSKVSSDATLWPVNISVGNKLIISERSMWGMVFDTTSITLNAKFLIISYITKLCQLAKETEHGYLLYSDEYQFSGSAALFAFMDLYLEEAESKTAAALPVYECFIQFIRCCDLEFETIQDEYIEKVLRKLAFVDERKLIELLCLRLCDGQLTNKDFRYLYQFLDRFTVKKGRLKDIIDYLTDNQNTDIDQSCRNRASLYLKLCAAIYGSHDIQTNEVMEYVNQKIDNKLKPANPFQLKIIERIRKECDAFREFQPTSAHCLNSSFHLYDQQNKQWLPLE